MSFDRPNHLSAEELSELLRQFQPGCSFSVTCIRSHNRGEIRRTVEMTAEALKELVLSSHVDGHQPGGDIEVDVPNTQRKLVGQHDGVYWLEPKSRGVENGI